MMLLLSGLCEVQNRVIDGDPLLFCGFAGLAAMMWGMRVVGVCVCGGAESSQHMLLSAELKPAFLPCVGSPLLSV